MRAVLALLVVLATAPVAAQDCPGDCTYDGQVKVAELILAVRVALGDLGVDSCFAADVNRDGAVAIDELVLAVSMLLNGCPAPSSPTATATLAATPTVTATPAESATATATESATPAATPTIPPVGGAWIEAPLTVGDSTCAEELTAAFADQLTARGPCAQEVETLDETSVRVTDCSAQAVAGTLDRDGTMHLIFPPADDTVGGCTVTLSVTSRIAGGAAPVTAAYTFGFVFGGEACPLDDCTIQASAPWTRPE